MADTLANLATTLTLGAEEDITILVCAKWVVLRVEDEFVQSQCSLYL